MARVYTLGAKKYADNNWKNGLERKRIEAALFRHFEASRSGEVNDPEDGQRHLASVAWCAFALMWYDMQAEKDDLRDAQRQIDEAADDHQRHVEARRRWEAAVEAARAATISSKHDGVARELDRGAWRGACPSTVGGRMVD